MTGTKMTPSNKQGSQDPSPSTEDFRSGDATRALYLAAELLLQEPDASADILKALSDQKLIGTPEAIAACITTGEGFEHLLKDDVYKGGAAAYAAFVTGTGIKKAEIALEVDIFIWGNGSALSQEQRDYLAHVISACAAAEGLAQSQTATLHIQSAKEYATSIASSSAPTASKEWRNFDSIVGRVNAVVVAAREVKKLPDAFFPREAQPSLENYVVAVAATNVPPVSGVHEQGLRFLNLFNPPLANELRSHGGHSRWPKG